MSSHLKKNPGDDNELGASQFVIIFYIWGKKPKDDDQASLTHCHLLHLKKKEKDDNKPGRLTIIYYV